MTELTPCYITCTTPVKKKAINCRKPFMVCVIEFAFAAEIGLWTKFQLRENLMLFIFQLNRQRVSGPFLVLQTFLPLQLIVNYEFW